MIDYDGISALAEALTANTSLKILGIRCRARWECFDKGCLFGAPPNQRQWALEGLLWAAAMGSWLLGRSQEGTCATSGCWGAVFL